jgi:hypothetical protein
MKYRKMERRGGMYGVSDDGSNILRVLMLVLGNGIEGLDIYRTESLL